MSDQPRPPKLLDRVRAACRVRHLSIRTEGAYHDWVRRFVLFHGVRHPDTMREPEVNACLPLHPRFGKAGLIERLSALLQSLPS